MSLPDLLASFASAFNQDQRLPLEDASIDAVLVVAGLWYFWLSSYQDELVAELKADRDAWREQAQRLALPAPDNERRRRFLGIF